MRPLLVCVCVFSRKLPSIRSRLFELHNRKLVYGMARFCFVRKTPDKVKSGDGKTFFSQILNGTSVVQKAKLKESCRYIRQVGKIKLVDFFFAPSSRFCRFLLSSNCPRFRGAIFHPLSKPKIPHLSLRDFSRLFSLGKMKSFGAVVFLLLFSALAPAAPRGYHSPSYHRGDPSKSRRIGLGDREVESYPDTAKVREKKELFCFACN